MKDIFSTKPDFVNDGGVKWWKDNLLTDNAQREDIHGTTLDATGYIVEEVNGHRTRLLISKAGTILVDDPTLDGIGAKIGILKAQKRFAGGY
jgi:hypothetical protein